MRADLMCVHRYISAMFIALLNSQVKGIYCFHILQQQHSPSVALFPARFLFPLRALISKPPSYLMTPGSRCGRTTYSGVVPNKEAREAIMNIIN